MHVIIVGAGISGLTAALYASDAGHTVTLVVKGVLGGGSTPLAQGGIAGVYGEGDSPAVHAADTFSAGARLGDRAAIDALVEGAAGALDDLVRWGVAFDRGDDGALLRGREAAHAFPRIAHAGGDATGLAITRALVRHVRSRTQIVVVEHAFVTDLLVDGVGVRRCRGIRMLVGAAHETTAVRDLEADAVVLATGGAGQLFVHTTNPAGATGDGIAVALRAGVAVADLEFMQFHPTMLASPEKGVAAADAGAQNGGAEPFLVSEAVRGEGAVLRDRSGRRFMFDTHPDGELAPRDVVARAIAHRSMADGAPVRLDATALGAEFLARRFPTIDRVTRARGFDWASQPIPVTPAAHYYMGGIVTDIDGRTNLSGLFAIGEVARTGVHGANRLASNSLLEGAVFAARAARALNEPPPATTEDRGHSGGGGTAEQSTPRRPDARDTVQRRDATTDSVDAVRRDGPVVPEICARVGAQANTFSRTALQHLMWKHVGLLRTPEGLAEAHSILQGWLSTARPPRNVSDHEDANLLTVATAMADAAASRPASVGAHHIDSSTVLIGI